MVMICDYCSIHVCLVLYTARSLGRLMLAPRLVFRDNGLLVSIHNPILMQLLTDYQLSQRIM
jgi:hypothetical protein